jgi:membrane fusion protein, multidrug efflux system
MSKIGTRTPIRTSAWRRLRHGGTASAAVSSAAAVGLIGVLLAGCKEEEHVRAPVAQPVQVMTVAMTPEAQSWSYVGVVRARYESDHAFRVAGKISERLVETGGRVEAGASIARLDPLDLRLALDAQRAELAAANASRDEAVAAAERFGILYRQGHAAKAALDQRVSAAVEARSRVERAERNVALAENQLAYADLKADQGGVVTALAVEVGQVVTTGQLVARIARLDAIEVEVAIPEHMLDKVRSARAEAELWGATGARAKAQLRELAPDADRASRTYRARFALAADADGIDLGRTATVHLTSGSDRRVTALPLAAVVNDGGGAFVWVVAADDVSVQRRPVEVAGLGQERVLVGNGLRDGERVVTLGAPLIDADKPVRVVETRTAISQLSQGIAKVLP